MRGACHVDCASLSDPVLVREDGTYLYTLPSVVDDIDLGVTHVIRGEDHVTNTAVQIQIFEALGAPAPAFAHHNLLTTASGEGLSKRLGHLSLASLREAGWSRMAVARWPCWSARPKPCGRSPPSTSWPASSTSPTSRARRRGSTRTNSMHLNARLVHGMPYDGGARPPGGIGIRGGEAFWNAVRANLATVSDAAAWWLVVEVRRRP